MFFFATPSTHKMPHSNTRHKSRRFLSLSFCLFSILCRAIETVDRIKTTFLYLSFSFKYTFSVQNDIVLNRKERMFGCGPVICYVHIKQIIMICLVVVKIFKKKHFSISHSRIRFPMDSAPF